MDNREEIIKMLNEAIEKCKKHGAVSLILSIDHEGHATNMWTGKLKDVAQAIAPQYCGSDDIFIQLLDKAVKIAKLLTI